MSISDSKVTCENEKLGNYSCGYIIGSHKNYYPIVPFKSPLMCGYHNITQFNNNKNKPVHFRDFWWRNINDLYESFKNSTNPVVQSYLRSDEVCFRYIDE